LRGDEVGAHCSGMAATRGLARGTQGPRDGAALARMTIPATLIATADEMIEITALFVAMRESFPVHEAAVSAVSGISAGRIQTSRPRLNMSGH
jgi:hypothetical protein